MTRWATTIFLTMTMFSFIGCSMCCGPYDFDYPTYGGIHHRSNPSQGRLGSPFSDPNYISSGPSADSNLKPHPEPKADRDLGLTDEDDSDLERVDEDLDDDLEGLDDDLDELDRRLEEMDLPDEELDPRLDNELDPRLDDELESIEPLEDVNARRINRNRSQAKSGQRQRRRGALPRRSKSLR